MTKDGRPRGEWRRTPWFLRVLGIKHHYMRAVFAHWRIGGGWDGWEWSDEIPQMSETSSTLRTS